MFKTGADPSHIIEEKKLIQIRDLDEIQKLAQKILSVNQKAVQDYQSGKTNALQFLIGQLMRETSGKVDPQKAEEVFKKLLQKY